MKVIIFLILILNLQAKMEEFLNCPWKESYNNNKPKSTECPFCNQFKSDKDQENLILKRYKYSIAILNKFPYNKGHLMIIPKKHVSKIYELSTEEQAELMHLCGVTTNILEKAYGFKNFNIGINLGREAGASIINHLHIHIVPRFIGEHGFQEFLFHAKVVSFDINKSYSELKPYFK